MEKKNLVPWIDTRIGAGELPENINWIIESPDGMAFINKAAFYPDQNILASLNPDFKSLVDSVLYNRR